MAYAVDLWEEGLAFLKKQASAQGITNIRALVADISKPLPIADSQIDVCLRAAVLHDLVVAGTAAGTLEQAARVLKPGGILAWWNSKR